MGELEKQLKEERLKRIEERKSVIKPKKDRKLMNYSANFTEIFDFFLSSYRKGILTFAGVGVDVNRDKKSDDGKFSFRLFDNGRFTGTSVVSKHPNILKAVITAKKSWGLHCKMWAEGICDMDFTKKEILSQFEEAGVTIPECFLKELNNKIAETYEEGYSRGKKQVIFCKIDKEKPSEDGKNYELTGFGFFKFEDDEVEKILYDDSKKEKN